MSEEGWTDSEYIMKLRALADSRRAEIESLRERLGHAEGQASAYRAYGRAEGFTAAREKAARIADEQPGGLAATAARLIRAMQDDSVREWHGCADPRGHQFSDGECRNDGCDMKIKP